MDCLWQDIRFGARLLWRAPGVTAAALIALTLGTGVNTALFSVVNAVLLQPLPFPEPHELVQLWRTEPPGLQFGAASYRRYAEWRARNRVFEEAGAWAPTGLTLTGREAPERLLAARASASLFTVLGAQPVAGRWFSERESTDAAHVVVVGETYWRQRMGASTRVLGSALTLDGAPYTVIGVAPASFDEFWRVDAWVPIPMSARATPGNFLRVFGRLRAGLTIDDARSGLRDLAAEMSRVYPEDRYGFNAIALHDVLTRGPRRALWILLGTTGLVLLIACANVANLLLARAVGRQREMAVRAAMGASRTRLLRQLVTETLLLTVTGGALGLLLASGLLRTFAVFAPASFPRLGEVGLDPAVLLFSTAVALACGLLAGVLPGLQVAGAKPGDALRDAASRGATSRRARVIGRMLVMSEVALAVMLVAAAGLMVKSLRQLTEQDLGLVTQNVLTFNVGAPIAGPQPPDAKIDAARVVRFFEAFEERIRALPGVTGAGAINVLPIAGTGVNGQVYVRGRQMKREEAPVAEFRVVTPAYFRSVGMQLLAGRLPDSRDAAESTPVVVINETMARQLWPGTSPAAAIGEFMGTGWDDGTTFREVIGVVRDVRSRRVEAPPDAETYVPLAQYPWETMTFTVRTAMGPEVLVPAIRDTLADLDPALPLASVRTFEEVLATATRSSHLYTGLTALFGILAATLAVVGIYSLMSYMVAQRTRELAIRSALGAPPRGLLGLVIREGFAMSAAGIVAGVAGALAASTLLQALLYEVRATDPVVLAASAAGLAAAAGAGYIVPAMRAASVDLTSALRE